MRLLLYSDLHFLDEAPAVPGIPGRLDFLRATCKWIGEQVLKYKPNYVFNLGDTNNLHGSISIAALQAMCESMDEITRACGFVKAHHGILAGNHDQGTVDGSINILSALGRAGISRQALLNHHSADNSEAIGCLAYRSSLKDFRSGYSASLAGGAKYMMIHQDVKDVLWRPGVPADHGVDPHMFKDAKFTFCGHYHHPQYFKNHRFAVVGSACYFNFTDSITVRPRGIVQFNTAVGVPEWIANPHTPLRHTLDASTSDSVLDWLKCGLVPESDWGRLLLKVKCKTEKVASNVKKKVKDLGLAQVLLTVPGSDKAETSEREIVLDSAEDAVRSFVKSASTKLDRKRLADVGLKAVSR